MYMCIYIQLYMVENADNNKKYLKSTPNKEVNKQMNEYIDTNTN